MEKSFELKKKYSDPYETNDVRNFVVTTNNRNGFKIETGDRRQYFVQVSSEMSSEGPKSAEEGLRYFSFVLGARYGQDEPARCATDAWIDEVAKQLYFFLMDQNISGFIPGDFPSSEIRQEQMEIHEDPFPQFFEMW
mmetsp:Transcript_11895/g.16113  ORF Transcript_11895/g.16113 Transcript_11895/m.16113 type:complete len:137 (-) Transcript_11895:755-1165(-)|eukprot:CAMPEP_0197300150 /NCGR_PEP_ID=MMETSP0890-20130614/47725_1 /TAXON_ID=44058 ORGANISM="Aureoumbra lagunensis, Strain CCMP1510" /NCGR_SAMPLE_ID=MMETSP0890 /ASSEMBLY_ACC=CAM_ASM_000533 /LENGTH=136 /DNA_ID=CAMNT_0042778831 /DNA_START=42 /DNA_END=452 /DNA_ORIENTATION=-